MEKPGLRVIQGERGDGEKTPSRYLSDKQRRSLRETEQGFIEETREDGSLTWSRLTPPNGIRDQEGTVWAIWVDEKRRNDPDGWQVWRCYADEEAFDWADRTTAYWSALPNVPDYPEMAQIGLRDGTLLNIIVQDGTEVYVQKFGDNKAMENVPPKPEVIVGEKAVAAVVKDPQIA